MGAVLHCGGQKLIPRPPLPSDFPGSDFPVATLFMSRASKLASGSDGSDGKSGAAEELERGRVRTTPHQLQDGPGPGGFPTMEGKIGIGIQGTAEKGASVRTCQKLGSEYGYF